MKPYNLIPMSDITDKAKDIAVAWIEGYVPHSSMYPEIAQKHKLASDIMNYAIEHESDEITRLRSELDKANEWVSVDKELPDLTNCGPYTDGKNYFHEKSIKVLAYSPSTIGITTAFYWGYNDDPMKGWSLMGVTHWKPLPEAPKK